MKYGHAHKSDKHKHKWGKYKTIHGHGVHHSSKMRKKFTALFKLNKASMKK